MPLVPGWADDCVRGAGTVLPSSHRKSEWREDHDGRLDTAAIRGPFGGNDGPFHAFAVYLFDYLFWNALSYCDRGATQVQYQSNINQENPSLLPAVLMFPCADKLSRVSLHYRLIMISLAAPKWKGGLQVNIWRIIKFHKGSSTLKYIIVIQHMRESRRCGNDCDSKTPSDYFIYDIMYFTEFPFTCFS